MLNPNYAVEVNDLTVGFGDFNLLSGVSFTLKPGSSLMIYGANGIGKSSLLRTLAGLQPYSLGRIVLDIDPFFLATSQPFHNDLTVYENLRFWQGVMKSTESKLDQIQHTFKLVPLWHVSFKYLSEGQKQRLKLSLLLLTPKKLWLIDEPFASLDLKYQKVINQIFDAHLSSHGSIIFSQPVDKDLVPVKLNLNDYQSKFR